MDSRVRGNDGWRGGELALSQERLDLFVRHEQLPTPRERPVLESPEIFHPHEGGRDGRYGFNDGAFGEAGVFGNVLCEAYLYVSSAYYFARGGN